MTTHAYAVPVEVGTLVEDQELRLRIWPEPDERLVTVQLVTKRTVLAFAVHSRRLFNLVRFVQGRRRLRCG